MRNPCTLPTLSTRRPHGGLLRRAHTFTGVTRKQDTAFASHRCANLPKIHYHYRGNLLTRKCSPLGPYRMLMPTVLARGGLRGWACCYGGGTPAHCKARSQFSEGTLTPVDVHTTNKTRKPLGIPASPREVLALWSARKFANSSLRGGQAMPDKKKSRSVCAS